MIICYCIIAPFWAGGLFCPLVNCFAHIQQPFFDMSRAKQKHRIHHRKNNNCPYAHFFDGAVAAHFPCARTSGTYVINLGLSGTHTCVMLGHVMPCHFKSKTVYDFMSKSLNISLKKNTNQITPFHDKSRNTTQGHNIIECQNIKTHILPCYVKSFHLIASRIKSQIIQYFVDSELFADRGAHAFNSVQTMWQRALPSSSSWFLLFLLSLSLWLLVLSSLCVTHARADVEIHCVTKAYQGNQQLHPFHDCVSYLQFLEVHWWKWLRFRTVWVAHTMFGMLLLC